MVPLVGGTFNLRGVVPPVSDRLNCIYKQLFFKGFLNFSRKKFQLFVFLMLLSVSENAMILWLFYGCTEESPDAKSCKSPYRYCG